MPVHPLPLYDAGLILAARRGHSCQEMLLRALDVYLEVCAVDCPCLRRDGD